MKKVMFIASLLLLISRLAMAKNVSLEGDAADSFIARHFPQAEIPGQIKDVFQYIDKNGKQRRGYADCFVPAMGARSDGAVSSCSIIY